MKKGKAAVSANSSERVYSFTNSRQQVCNSNFNNYDSVEKIFFKKPFTV